LPGSLRIKLPVLASREIHLFSEGVKDMRAAGWKMAVIGLGFYLGGVLSGSAAQALPKGMNYQGYVTDKSGVAYNGNQHMSFRIYTVPTGGTEIWSETQNQVVVKNGTFNTVIGQSKPLTLPYRGSYFLELRVFNGTTWDTMPNRISFNNAAGYSFVPYRVIYPSVITVAQGNGDTNSVWAALQVIGQEERATGAPNRWVVEVSAGEYDESDQTWSVPEYVTIRGQGRFATHIKVAGIVCHGGHVMLESLGINLNDAKIGINLENQERCVIQDCLVSGKAGATFINLEESKSCELLSTEIHAEGKNLILVDLRHAQYARLENCLLEYKDKAVTGSVGVYAHNIAFVTILGNTFEYLGAANHGILVNNSSRTSRISYNVFLGGKVEPACDIFNNVTGACPARDVADKSEGDEDPEAAEAKPEAKPKGKSKAAHTGARGICNQGSNGAMIPAF
jgi:hypothetical protein